MGSVIDGEDVVQDTLARALVALQELEEQGVEETPPLRPWLFRIAHNRALDLLRGRAVRKAEPIEAALDVADPASPDPVEMLMRQEAVKTAVSRFAELPSLQRSVVILKDVLDEQLSEIAALLDLTVDAVKGHLARGRARLREINAQAGPLLDARPARWRAMSRCSTSGTGTACGRSWPTTSNSINPRTRLAPAVRRSVSSSPSTTSSKACGSRQPGSRAGR